MLPLDPTLTDALLAIAHHLLAFALAIVLTMEIMLARRDITGPRLSYLTRLDAAYGAIAAGILIIGVGRVVYGLRGPEYYLGNGFFWAKMVAFAGVALLSIRPTVSMIRWRSRLSGDPDFRPAPAEIMTVRRFLHSEAVLFTFIPIFAALMARYG